MNSVLIVDDEDGMRKLLTRWLAPEGYEIREAPDAEAALAEMGTRAADVVMCDVEMPGQGGLWLAGELGARFPATAIVLATAVATVPPVTSLKPSVVAYLVKPFSQTLVVQAVARAAKWHGRAAATPPRPRDDGSRLTKWLDQE